MDAWLPVVFSFVGALSGGLLAAQISVRATRRHRLEDAYVELSGAVAESVLGAFHFVDSQNPDPDRLVKLTATGTMALTRILLQEPSGSARREVHKLDELMKDLMGIIAKGRSLEAAEREAHHNVVFAKSQGVQDQLKKMIDVARQELDSPTA